MQHLQRRDEEIQEQKGKLSHSRLRRSNLLPANQGISSNRLGAELISDSSETPHTEGKESFEEEKVYGINTQFSVGNGGQSSNLKLLN